MIHRRRSLVLEEAIIQARKSGMLIADIAKLVKRSEVVVKRVLRIAELTSKKKRGIRFSPYAAEGMRALRRAGLMNVKQLANHYKTSTVTVWRKLKEDSYVDQRGTFKGGGAVRQYTGDQHEQRVA